jgi:hypothetical protein
MYHFTSSCQSVLFALPLGNTRAVSIYLMGNSTRLSHLYENVQFSEYSIVACCESIKCLRFTFALASGIGDSLHYAPQRVASCFNMLNTAGAFGTPFIVVRAP